MSRRPKRPRPTCPKVKKAGSISSQPQGAGDSRTASDEAATNEKRYAREYEERALREATRSPGEAAGTYARDAKQKRRTERPGPTPQKRGAAERSTKEYEES